jgi:hypothetical protein
MRTEDAWRHVRVERAFRDLGIPVVCPEKAS